MGLQFGIDKCVKMHIGKNENLGICAECKVDVWKDDIVKHMGEHDQLQDKYVGEEVMKIVHEKKYLGDIFSDDMKNEKIILEKSNKAIGVVNKIVTSLNERPYGVHTYKASIAHEGKYANRIYFNQLRKLD